MKDLKFLDGPLGYALGVVMLAAAICAEVKEGRARAH